MKVTIEGSLEEIANVLNKLNDNSYPKNPFSVDKDGKLNMNFTNAPTPV